MILSAGLLCRDINAGGVQEKGYEAGSRISSKDFKDYQDADDLSRIISEAKGCVEDGSYSDIERLDCYRYLIGAYIKQGKYLEASEACKQSLNLKGDVHDVEGCAALIEKARGQDAAIACWQEFSDRYPKTAGESIEGLKRAKAEGRLFYQWFLK